MEKTKTLLFVFILFVLAYSCQSDNKNAVTFKFEGKKYNNLLLRLDLDLDIKKLMVEGKSKDGYTWEFNYPDTLHRYIRFATFEEPIKNDTIQAAIAFYIVTEKGDTLKSATISFSKQSEIHAKHFRSYNLKNGEQINAYFLDKNADRELLSAIEAMPILARLYNTNDEGKIDKYINIIKKYPNSQFIASFLALTLNYYKPHEIERLYNCFDKKIKESHFGKMIYKYMTNVFFVNSILPIWDTENLELIIQDSTKYNLIIFSASWCAPCHAIIPLLKEIHNDLGAKLEMTYVSMDKIETVNQWKELMRKEEIPWRSLIATNNNKEIGEKYNAIVIPHIILVHPENMEMEVIDVRKEEDKSRLYDLVNSEK